MATVRVRFGVKVGYQQLPSNHPQPSDSLWETWSLRFRTLLQICCLHLIPSRILDLSKQDQLLTWSWVLQNCARGPLEARDNSISPFLIVFVNCKVARCSIHVEAADGWWEGILISPESQTQLTLRRIPHPRKHMIITNQNLSQTRWLDRNPNFQVWAFFAEYQKPNSGIRRWYISSKLCILGQHIITGETRSVP